MWRPGDEDEGRKETRQQEDREPMNQEEIERNIAFIVDQQAKFFADIEELKALNAQAVERANRTDARLSRAIRLGIAEARQERAKRRESEERLSAKMDILLDAQIRAEERQAKADERQARTENTMDDLKQALAEMARAITATNQRIDDLGRKPV